MTDFNLPPKLTKKSANHDADDPVPHSSPANEEWDHQSHGLMELVRQFLSPLPPLLPLPDLPPPPQKNEEVEEK